MPDKNQETWPSDHELLEQIAVIIASTPRVEEGGNWSSAYAEAHFIGFNEIEELLIAHGFKV
jgi:hypothetical protein